MGKTVKELAEEAGGYLRRDAERDIVLPVDGAPEWFTELCRHAHGEFMPDDWRYEFIQDALSSLEDEVGESRGLDSTYPYTHDRLSWLASNLNRPGYCDEAAEDFGAPKDILSFIALGMYAEMNEVYDLVRERLEELAEESEAE